MKNRSAWLPDTVRLEQFASEPEATWGRLYVPTIEQVLFTVSPPRIFNRPYASRINDGLYELVPHDSEKHPGSWAFLGPGVTHHPGPDGLRSTCLLHSANFARQLAGCTAPGDSIGSILGEVGVTNSRLTLERISKVLRNMGSRVQIEVVSIC